MSFSPPQPIPVYIAATGPQMLRLTGRIADGVVLSGGLTVGHVRYSLDRIAEGARAARARAGGRPERRVPLFFGLRRRAGGGGFPARPARLPLPQPRDGGKHPLVGPAHRPRSDRRRGRETRHGNRETPCSRTKRWTHSRSAARCGTAATGSPPISIPASPNPSSRSAGRRKAARSRSRSCGNSRPVNRYR